MESIGDGMGGGGIRSVYLFASPPFIYDNYFVSIAYSLNLDCSTLVPLFSYSLYSFL